ncbi:Aminotransferase [Lactococcus lactis subsp. lactis A12]|uniref:Aminotransferase n=1 Tax=Lactococcus lactis subsp. lactis A12 TaxID=1137134 RepID=S6F1F7_LACLL|nr:Aminotransferase [Lactococcus lactis subsp. lactis A12]
MELVQFGCEDWLNVWEKSATIDIAQSTIDSLSLEEILAFEEDNGEAFISQMMKEKFSYGWIEGSPALNQKWQNFIKECQRIIFYLQMELPEQISLQF